MVVCCGSQGADCLSKYVGEAERQLRLLFEQAKKMQPSIIFFDEIDGLAPVRTMKVDQVHSSIVSTLLALMDGLDNRGQVVVIGATNRVDAVDPALRRPGRFDRELSFTLPNKVRVHRRCAQRPCPCSVASAAAVRVCMRAPVCVCVRVSQDARRCILDIHSRKWTPALCDSFKDAVATATAGYCGADVKALCTESILRAIRRRYPQIYSSTRKLVIDVAKVHVTLMDFVDAYNGLTPASHR